MTKVRRSQLAFLLLSPVDALSTPTGDIIEEVAAGFGTIFLSYQSVFESQAAANFDPTQVVRTSAENVNAFCDAYYARRASSNPQASDPTQCALLRLSAEHLDPALKELTVKCAACDYSARPAKQCILVLARRKEHFDKAYHKTAVNCYQKAIRHQSALSSSSTTDTDSISAEGSLVAADHSADPSPTNAMDLPPPPHVGSLVPDHGCKSTPVTLHSTYTAALPLDCVVWFGSAIASRLTSSRCQNKALIRVSAPDPFDASPHTLLENFIVNVAVYSGGKLISSDLETNKSLRFEYKAQDQL